MATLETFRTYHHSPCSTIISSFKINDLAFLGHCTTDYFRTFPRDRDLQTSLPQLFLPHKTKNLHYLSFLQQIFLQLLRKISTERISPFCNFPCLHAIESRNSQPPTEKKNKTLNYFLFTLKHLKPEICYTCDTSFLDLFVSTQILDLVKHLQITPNTFPLLAINSL